MGVAFRDNWRLILEEIRSALSGVDQKQVEGFVDAVLAADKVFFIGVGWAARPSRPWLSA